MGLISQQCIIVFVYRKMVSIAATIILIATTVVIYSMATATHNLVHCFEHPQHRTKHNISRMATTPLRLRKR